MLFIFTKVSNCDESNCLNEENECPPIIDKSTIECPQIEVLYTWLVYLRFDLLKCHPLINEKSMNSKKACYLHIL